MGGYDQMDVRQALTSTLLTSTETSMAWGSSSLTLAVILSGICGLRSSCACSGMAKAELR